MSVWVASISSARVEQAKAAKAWLANFIPPRNVKELPAKKQNHQMRYVALTVILLIQDLIQWQRALIL